MRTRRILIVTNSLDRPVIEPVVKKLTGLGYAPLIYEADRVAVGEKHLAIHINMHGFEAVYDGYAINNETVSAAWFRRPGNTGPLFPSEDHAYRMWLDRERISSQNAIWETIAASKWLNSPPAIKRAENKLTQLALAQSIGFTIPETVISNSRGTIGDIIRQDMVLKMHQGLVTAKGEYSSHYTSVIPYNPMQRPAGFPYPGIWQPYIQKTKEWRITLVEDEVFDVAIYTKGQAKADWRRHQQSSLVEFRPERFPGKLKAMCRKMLKHLGLRFGAFDFIEQPDGLVVFIELNANGQYAWLERDLDLPISDAIAASLINTAKSQV